MANPKRASDDYINYRKKFTDRDKIRLIKILCRELVLTPQELLDKFICDALAKESKKLQS
jgi:hypothetical protein